MYASRTVILAVWVIVPVNKQMSFSWPQKEDILCTSHLPLTRRSLYQPFAPYWGTWRSFGNACAHSVVRWGCSLWWEWEDGLNHLGLVIQKLWLEKLKKKTKTLFSQMPIQQSLTGKLVCIFTLFLKLYLYFLKKE